MQLHQNSHIFMYINIQPKNLKNNILNDTSYIEQIKSALPTLQFKIHTGNVQIQISDLTLRSVTVYQEKSCFCSVQVLKLKESVLVRMRKLQLKTANQFINLLTDLICWHRCFWASESEAFLTFYCWSSRRSSQ